MIAHKGLPKRGTRSGGFAFPRRSFAHIFPVMTPVELRAQFPMLQSLTWLNAAASSPCPLPVYEAMTAHLKETFDSGDMRYPTWARLKDEVRARLARFIGAVIERVITQAPNMLNTIASKVTYTSMFSARTSAACAAA